MSSRRHSESARRQPNVAAAPSKSADRVEIATGPLAPGLYVVSTPIGNLGDITLRAIETLKHVEAIACEDTRVTSVLLRRYGIATPLTPYHDHNADKVRPRLVARLRDGGKIALVSDAGTPLLSDPGFKLVQACAEAEIAVVPVPGASALLAALVSAGLPTDRVLFAGFLPPKSAARRRALAEVKDVPATLVFYETGPRLGDSANDMLAELGDRPATVCRELTKRFEEVRRGSLATLARHYTSAEAPRGEIVVVIGGPLPVETSVDDVDAALRDALRTLTVRDAAAAVAAQLKQSKREVYARALELARNARERTKTAP